MAISKTSVSVLASGSAAAGSTKAAPGMTGSAIDCRAYYGGELTYKLTNGSSAPGVAPTLQFQASPDGTSWYDYYAVGGDTTASSVNTGSLVLDRGVMYVRAIVFGNTTNAITAEAGLQAITGL